MRNIPVQPKGDMAQYMLRAIGFILILDFVALFVSLPLFVVCHAGAMGIFRLAPYWMPARKLSNRVLGDYPFPIMEFPLRLGNWIHLIFTISVVALFIGFGIWIILHDGFCSLSILCFYYINNW